MITHTKVKNSSEQYGVNNIESLQDFHSWRILATFCKGNVVSTFKKKWQISKEVVKEIGTSIRRTRYLKQYWNSRISNWNLFDKLHFTILPNNTRFGRPFEKTRPDTRPYQLRRWAGAEMRVFTLFDSFSRTDRRTDGPTRSGQTDGQRVACP